jgi:hypothetical protein
LYHWIDRVASTGFKLYRDGKKNIELGTSDTVSLFMLHLNRAPVPFYNPFAGPQSQSIASTVLSSEERLEEAISIHCVYSGAIIANA